MPTHPAYARIAAACALLLISAHASPAADPPEKAPAAIAEVHTWGDLLAQKPIPLAGPGSALAEVHDQNPSPACRVGIDLTFAKLHGAAILYCLSDTDRSSYSVDRIGPLDLDVSTPQDKAKEAILEMHGGQAASAKCFLFIKIIPFTAPGDYTISLRVPTSEHDNLTAPPPVAITKITITKDDTALPGWSPWGFAKNADTEDSRSEGEDNPVSNPATATAIPDWPAVSRAFGELPDPKLPLPPLIPAQPDPHLHLSIAGNRLTFKSDSKELPGIDFFGSILTRWWVNGKPFTPPAPENGEVPPDNTENGAVTLEDEYNYLIEFHPEILHAKKGDTIGLQLLYCPGGFQYTLPQQVAKPDAAYIDSSPQDPPPLAISRLSPRIEFIYTGDPAAISPDNTKKSPEVK